MTYEWFEQNPLLGLDNNPFMPKEISLKIQLFKIWLPLRIDAEIPEKVIYIDLDRDYDKSIIIKSGSGSFIIQTNFVLEISKHFIKCAKT